MSIRMIVATLAVGLSVGTAIAQQDPVTVREDLMKKNNDHAKAVVQMMRGQAPFDAAAVDAAFKQWADTAQKLPALFPDNSKRLKAAIPVVGKACDDCHKEYRLSKQ
jgi:cytochrome c556